MAPPPRAAMPAEATARMAGTAAGTRADRAESELAKTRQQLAEGTTVLEAVRRCVQDGWVFQLHHMAPKALAIPMTTQLRQHRRTSS